MRLPRLNRASLKTYLSATAKLKKDTPRRFGTMSPNQMVRHLRHTLEVVATPGCLKQLPDDDRGRRSQAGADERLERNR